MKANAPPAFREIVDSMEASQACGGRMILAPNNKPAGAVARPAGLTYFAEGNAARVLIARQPGNGHDAIALRKNPIISSKRCWLTQFNELPWFSIKEEQLLSLSRFRLVATCQLAHRGCHLDLFVPDLYDLPEIGWCESIKQIIASLKQGGVE